MINGIINVYKEKGFTSFDVVAVMRGISGQRKVGHTGTLDPDAEGVLPICLGNATKLCDMLTDRTKEYVATFLLGTRTDTLDIGGEVLERKEVTVTEEELRAAAVSFVGGYEQVPPMFSAKKVDGKRLYDLARKGVEVERKPVWVDIASIEFIDVSLPEFTIKVSCGKGTYIRSLGEDIAAKCGELAVMKELKRTRVSAFTVDKAHTLDELTDIKNRGELLSVVLSTECVFEELPVLTVKQEFRKLIDNGNKIKKDQTVENLTLKDGDRVRMHNDEGTFVGVFEFRKREDAFVPYKVFMSED